MKMKFHTSWNFIFVNKTFEDKMLVAMMTFFPQFKLIIIRTQTKYSKYFYDGFACVLVLILDVW